MKRLFLILIVAAFMFSICGCSSTHLNTSADVTLTFIFGEENICVTLEADEAKNVIRILNGRSYSSIASGMPSCGFNPNVSLSVGGRSFAIACDTCNCVQDLSNLRFFDISQEDVEYIHSLFEKYGGYFPCI